MLFIKFILINFKLLALNSNYQDSINTKKRKLYNRDNKKDNKEDNKDKNINSYNTSDSSDSSSDSSSDNSSDIQITFVFCQLLFLLSMVNQDLRLEYLITRIQLLG